MIRYRLLVLVCAFFLITVPVAANLHKINPGAPVFIGERNLDLSSPLNGHSVIAWWPAGSDRSGAPEKSITVAVSTSFSIDPCVFTGYTGKWYTNDVKPDIFVFDVMVPSIDLKVWDTDKNQDITGQSVTTTTNITYRIDTNLYLARKYTSRPDYNPSDNFFTVTLTDTRSAPLSQILTGSIGGKKTQIINIEKTPVITASPYYWREGSSWDKEARSADGSFVYPPGMYTFKVVQDLNSMLESYPIDSSDAIGKVTSGDKTITFLEVKRTTSPTAPITAALTTATTQMTTQQTGVKTSIPTATVSKAKTTYQPLPEWLALLGVSLGAIIFVCRRSGK